MRTIIASLLLALCAAAILVQANGARLNNADFSGPELTDAQLVYMWSVLSGDQQQGADGGALENGDVPSFKLRIDLISMVTGLSPLEVIERLSGQGIDAPHEKRNVDQGDGEALENGVAPSIEQRIEVMSMLTGLSPLELIERLSGQGSDASHEKRDVDQGDGEELENGVAPSIEQRIELMSMLTGLSPLELIEKLSGQGSDASHEKRDVDQGDGEALEDEDVPSMDQMVELMSTLTGLPPLEMIERLWGQAKPEAGFEEEDVGPTAEYFEERDVENADTASDGEDPELEDMPIRQRVQIMSALTGLTPMELIQRLSGKAMEKEVAQRDVENPDKVYEPSDAQKAFIMSMINDADGEAAEFEDMPIRQRVQIMSTLTGLPPMELIQRLSGQPMPGAGVEQEAAETSV